MNMQLNYFYSRYYNGEKTAPILTVFIGGNHEASNYLQELPYGGWVAPNIYYLGYAGVINIAGTNLKEYFNTKQLNNILYRNKNRRNIWYI